MSELIDTVPVRISAVLWARHRLRSAAARTLAQLVRDRYFFQAGIALTAAPAVAGRDGFLSCLLSIETINKKHFHL